MSPTSSLRDLLRIRRRHLRWLRALPGYLGSAVGYKYLEDSGRFDRDAGGAPIPAVLVFVVEKRAETTLRRRGELIPPTLDGPGGLSCATDVVRGTLPHAATQARGEHRAVQRELHEADLPIVGGIPLSSSVCTGTAGCVVRSTAPRDAGALGVLTNWHVAGLPGNRLLRPPPRLQLVGTTARAIFTAPRGTPDTDDLESFTDAGHRLDAGFVAVPEPLWSRTAPGVHSLGPLGAAHDVDLASMDLLGQPVVSVGQMLGRRRGHIAAYGYEWRPDPDDHAYHTTDYLILGENGQAFAAPGDSGKLVVTDDAARAPVALLWGGERQEFWTAQAQETWSYASAIGLVLRQLEVAIVGTTAESAAAAGAAGRKQQARRAPEVGVAAR